MPSYSTIVPGDLNLKPGGLKVVIIVTVKRADSRQQIKPIPIPIPIAIATNLTWTRERRSCRYVF
tara:strand:- start:135 stop:329 length:195 start_codon:yes stop_codon:yes gene_type:complete